jgi:RNA polymerase sigma-70 factor (ECF subfamily)
VQQDLTRELDASRGTAAGGGQYFRTTHWSVVLAACDIHSPQSEAALEKLCRTYWYPIYAHIRRQGHEPCEAQDLTQEFFCRLLGSESLRSVEPRKGLFRSFLLASVRHFLANEWDRASRLKRGGAYKIFSWDGLEPEERYRLEPAQVTPIEQAYDRQWAQSLVAETLARLRTEYAHEGSERRFEVLKTFLSGADVAYATAAKELALSESAVRSAIHRMRQRYAELFRAEVANTVPRPEDVEPEIRHLFAVLAS